MLALSLMAETPAVAEKLKELNHSQGLPRSTQCTLEFSPELHCSVMLRYTILVHDIQDSSPELMYSLSMQEFEFVLFLLYSHKLH